MFGFNKKSELERMAEAVQRDTGSGATRSVDFLIEQGAGTLQDLMFPPAIYEDTDHIRYSESEMCCVLAITHWPPHISVGWFQQLVNIYGKIDISMQIHPVQHALVEDYLSRKMRDVTSSAEAEARRGKDPKIVFSLQQQDIETMQAAVGQRRENFFQVTVLLCVYGSSEGDLIEQVKIVQNMVREIGLEAKPLVRQQHQGLAAVFPIGLDGEMRAYQNFYTSALATGFPFVTGSLRQEQGIWHGMNLNTGNPIFYNNFLKGGGFNQLIVGKQGSGKSFAVKVLAGRYAQQGVEVFVIDPSPQAEYANMAKQLGGTVVNVSATSDEVLNPFDLAQVKNTAATRLGGSTETAIAASKGIYLLGLFELLGEGAFGQLDTVALDGLFTVLYETKGISLKDPSTYGLEPPTMTDFNTMLNTLIGVAEAELSSDEKIQRQLRALRSKLESDPAWAQGVQGRTVRYYFDKRDGGEIRSGVVYSEQDITTFKHIRTILQPYIVGSKEGFFKGKSNVRADTQMVVFQVGESTGRMLDIAMYIVFGEIYNRVLSEGNEKKKIIVIDEAWKLLQHELAGKNVESLLREGRKMGAGVWIVSQNLKDFLDSERGGNVITLAAVQIIMKLERTEAERFRETYEVPKQIANAIPNFDVGEGLLRFSEQHGRTVTFKLEATSLERAMASTSSAELENLRRN